MQRFRGFFSQTQGNILICAARTLTSTYLRLEHTQSERLRTPTHTRTHPFRTASTSVPTATVRASKQRVVKLTVIPDSFLVTKPREFSPACLSFVQHENDWQCPLQGLVSCTWPQRTLVYADPVSLFKVCLSLLLHPLVLLDRDQGCQARNTFSPLRSVVLGLSLWCCIVLADPSHLGLQ